ncbi:MAG: hypothetical protein ACI86X_000675 [Moritella sp.]|jgi:hypothetical protein
MPFLLIPLLAGGVGFGAGFWTGSSVSKLIKLGAVGGGCYVAYQVYKGAK